MIDRGYLRDFAQAYEKGGFDRALIGYYSDTPDGLLVGGYVAEQTERLGLLIAHRPGLDHHSLQSATASGQLQSVVETSACSDRRINGLSRGRP